MTASSLRIAGFSVLTGGVIFAAQVGEPVDVVPFGQITQSEPDGTDYGVIWEDARDVFRVVVVFADGSTPPAADSLRLEYWHSGWPQRRIPREEVAGAGSSGWLDVGDWFQGKWKAADANLDVKGRTFTYTFNPVNAREHKDLDGFAATYRTTMKLRIVGQSPLPKVASFQAFTDSTWKRIGFEVEWGGTAAQEQNWDGRIETFNGLVERVEPLRDNSGVRLTGNEAWRSRVRGRTDGIRAAVLYAETKACSSFDRTIVTVRANQETFSFAPTDLIRAGRVLIPDFGVLIRKSGDSTTYADALAEWRRATARPRHRSIYDRVADAPEQTLTQAWNDTPAKKPHYIPLGFEGGRQNFGVDENGDVFCDKNWIARLRGKDTARCLWEGNAIRYNFGLRGAQLVSRSTVDGCLPMIVGAWERDGVRYEQTAFAVPLRGVPNAGGRIWADDTLVLMVRFRMQNVGDGEPEARLDIDVSHDGGDTKLHLDGDRIVAAGKPARPRMRVTTTQPADRAALAPADKRIAYRAKLTKGAGTRQIDFAIPYVTLADDAEWAQLRSISFDKAFQAVRNYWKGRVENGTRIRTPEPMINDYYRATVSHLLINTEREIGVSDRYMAKVGSFHYGVFSNESCMMISDLDRRGYHERAEQALETWLHYQGTVSLPGDFSTADGQFYGAGGYEHGGYNQHHGWVLWCLGEHYWHTRDAGWLQRAAPHIVKGCDWITGERRRTIAEAERNPIRAIERGLLPPGRLEDIGDWRCWLATNVFSWWGMQNAAAALAAAGHPDGKRLLAEAEAYRKDLIAAFTEAMRRSPVVPLRDGSWIPHMPSDVHRRGRSFGWITETLEGAIHLIRCGAIDPHDRLATWILKDFEDNLYISEQFGYDMKGPTFDRFWFSHGGISMQANLLCSPLPYLLRDEPKHYLRAYFNAFAVSYFPDTRMMTEHALPNIGDWRGDHYKSSDEANSTFWLRLMFVQERGDELWLGSAIPRYWLADGQTVAIENASTYFGPMSMQLTSHAARGEIEMRITPPLRNPPRVIRARFRHSDGRRMTRVTIHEQGAKSGYGGSKLGSSFNPDGSYKRFNPDTEWVDLDMLKGPTSVVAHYD